MATQWAVDLVFKANTSKLKDATDKFDKLEKKAKGAQQGATNAANGIRGFGRAAAGASAGVRTFGAAVQAALGPLAILGGAVGTLSAAFQTLSQQDFAEAKVRSLGTDSEELVAQLKQVSAELKGQASVVELTGAAYDVASAGFVKAADAAKVLKAASLGATGGFSDINTVGNAATSVLNAYGLSADHAAGLVDKFIQTQNDGKIVVAEYAQNIGKVASAAAGLGIPLSEVNAVISQATASGVQAEIAFTGLKGALARLASGEAGKALEEYGININAATIEADGLLGTLKKLEGLDTGTLFKALGTEAGPALLPVIQNLERFEELIAKQENSAGAAARAQAEAANTIQGAWKALQTEFSNFFSEQSALGDVLKVTLFGLAEAVKIFAQSVNFLLAPFKAIVEAAFQVASALDQAFGITEKIERVKASFTQFGTALKGIFGDLVTTVSNVWSGFIDELGVALGPLKQQWDDFTKGVSEAWNETTTVLTQYWDLTVSQISEAATGLGNWIQGVWGSISQGAQGIIEPIGNAFKAAFDYAKSIIDGFWNSLPNWLKGALSAAGSAIGGVANAVGTALNSVKGEIGKAIQGSGKPAPAGGTGTVEKPAPVKPPGGGGGGGGGKTASGVDQTAQLQQQLALKQQLFAIEQQMQAAILAGDKVQIQALERKKIEAELDNAIALAKGDGLKVEVARLEAAEKLGKLEFDAAKKEQDRKKSLEDMLTKFDREIELAGIKGEEAKKLKQIEYDILDARKEGLLVGDDEIEKYRQRAQAAAQAGGGNKGKLQGYMDKLKTELEDTEGMIVSLAQTVEGEIGSAMSNAITGLIDGTQTAQEAFSTMFKNIGKAFIDMATQMIAKALIMKVLGILSGGIGGGGGGGGLFSQGLNTEGTLAGGGIFSGAGPYKFAEGGYVNRPTNALIGEAGEAEYVIPASKMGAAMSRYQAGQRGGSVIGGPGGGGADGGNNTFTLETVVINNVEYATVAQVRQMGAAAAKQGAAGGYAKTMGSMRNSRATRARLGMA